MNCEREREKEREGENELREREKVEVIETFSKLKNKKDNFVKINIFLFCLTFN